MSVKRKDPLPVFCFQVIFTDLKDIDKNYFKSVSGLRSETEVIPVRAGGANATTYNLVGAIKWSPIVLKQGFTVSTKLLDWRESWVAGPFGTGKKPFRTDGSIIQLDTALKAVAVWDFKRAWPSKWELGDFDASKNELQIESLEIVHEGLTYNATNSGLE
jgi:phage tail-like protein